MCSGVDPEPAVTFGNPIHTKLKLTDIERALYSLFLHKIKHYPNYMLLAMSTIYSTLCT